jgi:hypothetical protein
MVRPYERRAHPRLADFPGVCCFSHASAFLRHLGVDDSQAVVASEAIQEYLDIGLPAAIFGEFIASDDRHEKR